MPWTAQQLAMLKEMGLTVWWPGAEAPPLGARAPATPPPGEDAARGAHAAEVAARPPAGPETEARAAGVPPAPAPADHPATRPVHPAASPAAVASPSAARRIPGIEQMDWPALRAAVAGCTACALCESRRQTVFGVGAERARWMVVGEAPGEHEDRQGEPFVGKAGQLLDRMLAAVGLGRSVAADGEADPGAAGAAAEPVFIANVLKCRPPGNRNPLPEEVAQCEPFLKRQVELVQPQLILAMGRFAVQSLLRTTEPIGRLRGRVHQYAGVPVVVTYHPAYLLRNPIDKGLAWDDLCLAREVIGEPAYGHVPGGQGR